VSVGTVGSVGGHVDTVIISGMMGKLESWKVTVGKFVRRLLRFLRFLEIFFEIFF